MIMYPSAMLNMDIYSRRQEYQPMPECHVSLVNTKLWNDFHQVGTEMIITKSGRRMFPAMNVQVSQLNPQEFYCVLLVMEPVGRCRYKYNNSTKWTPAGPQEAQGPPKIYRHPDSPATGEFWMSQPISFGRLKLTNTISPPDGQLLLSSMHKYQPRIVIAKTSHPALAEYAPSSSVAFPEAEFIAVTAYQNEKVTKLKIDNNPFAKGFRENGQAKCKRKRQDSETIEGETTSKVPKMEPLLSPTASSSSSARSSPAIIQPPVQPHQEACPVRPNLIPIRPVMYPIYPYPFYPEPWSYSFYPTPFVRFQTPVVENPRKLTDFSIKAITGFS